MSAEKKGHKRPPAPKAGKERLMTLLISPHVSEKAARASESANQYVFRVRTDATKPEIRAAVELMFDVAVSAVQVVNVAGKGKRFGRSLGKRNDWKKAYVSLKAGQTIDLSGPARA
jgi:large subunit ribosomal protein L23